MITTVADFLQALIGKEKAKLAAEPVVNHGPTIGDMYEGLTRELLARSMFRGLNLHVVDGMIEDETGRQSGQIDCMLVEGDGHKVRWTNHHIYQLAQVIAVIEVKKNLYGKDLSDSFFHLRGLKNPKTSLKAWTTPLVRDAWRSLMKSELPTAEELTGLSEEAQIIHTTLVIEAHMPVRVVFGYYGYAGEFELRRGLIKFLESEVAPMANPTPKPGFGIYSFPNLIVCRDASLVKVNGMPFAAPLSEDGFWRFYGSRSSRPLEALLELIWTRLAYRYNLDASLFGEDLKCEAVNSLLKAKWRGPGWEFRYCEVPDSQLNEGPDSTEWEPETVSLAQFVVLNKLCSGQEVRLADSALVEFLKEEGTTPDALATDLNEKRLAYTKNGCLHLLTDGCSCAVLPDGRYVAGENKTGRLLRWIDRFMEKRKGGVA